MNEKYILQYGSLAGWPHKVAEALRKKGVNSKNYIFYDKDVADLSRNLPYDAAVCQANDNFFKKTLAIPKFIDQISKECSLVHYHSSNVFFRELHWLYEGPKLKKAEIPMLLSFGGGDARIVKRANELNPYFYRENNVIKDFVIKMRYRSWKQNIPYCATDPEMVEYAAPHFDEVFTFRQPVNLEQIECNYPNLDVKIPIILHIPTEPWVKGTENIEKAVENLKAKGLKFEFRKLRQLTQLQVYDEISKCDVYVDELRCGSHGVTAVESMAAGKPTITYIRDDLVDKYPSDLPLVNANIDTIQAVLAELIDSAKLRNEIGIKSRLYVEKYHDSEIVAQDLIEIYSKISNA
ncbi:MAG: glycosyltransferase [Colwellia sp.]